MAQLDSDLWTVFVEEFDQLVIVMRYVAAVEIHYHSVVLGRFEPASKRVDTCCLGRRISQS